MVQPSAPLPRTPCPARRARLQQPAPSSRSLALNAAMAAPRPRARARRGRSTVRSSPRARGPQPAGWTRGVGGGLGSGGGRGGGRGGKGRRRAAGEWGGGRPGGQARGGGGEGGRRWGGRAPQAPRGGPRSRPLHPAPRPGSPGRNCEGPECQTNARPSSPQAGEADAPGPRVGAEREVREAKEEETKNVRVVKKFFFKKKFCVR